MPTDLTNNIIFASTNNITNSYSSSTAVVADGDAFSSALDNASKSYTDKSENTSVTNSANDKKVAQKTKDISSSNQQKNVESTREVPENNKKNLDNKVSSDKSVQSENSEKTDSKDESSVLNNTNESQDAEISETDCSNQENITDLNFQQNEINNVGSQNPVVVLSSDAVVNMQEALSENTESVSDAVVGQQTVKQNAIVNEQMLANIEYSNTADIEAVLKEQIPDIDEKTLKALVNEAEKNSLTRSEQASTIQNTTTLSDISTLNEDTVNFVKNTSTSESQVQSKTSVNNVINDVSRLTSGVEEVSVEPETVDLKLVTPSETESEKEPVIRVAQEVAINTEARKISAEQGLENKDTVSKIKDKAVSQMTKLQDTDTVVTQSTVVNSEESQQQGTLSQNNAQEQVVKLSVEEGTNSINSVTSTESFASRLESQMLSRTAISDSQTLNRGDVMSQVNAKFEQLAQTGTNKVSIVLQPENLGRVSVEIMSTKEGVVAKMLTDNQQVKDLFDKNIDALKNNLSSQGVNVNSIKVECSQESSNNAMNFERDQFNQAFNNQQNSSHHQQTNQSETGVQNAYGQDGGDIESTEVEITQDTEIKNTDTIIKHNGKVDYTV